MIRYYHTTRGGVPFHETSHDGKDKSEQTCDEILFFEPIDFLLTTVAAVVEDNEVFILVCFIYFSR